MSAPTPVPVATVNNEVLVRQAPLKLNLPKAVAIVGCGGVGSWVALTLALAGVPKIFLFDHDVVSPSNLNRIPVPESAVGKKKTEAMRDIITMLRPQCDVYCMSDFSAEVADGLKLYSDITWLIATTDSHSSRQECYKWTQKIQGKPYYSYVAYLEASAEGEYGSIAKTPAEFASDLESDPGYASVPVWIGPCLTSAFMASSFVLHACLPETVDQFRLGFEAPTWDDKADKTTDARIVLNAHK